MFIGEYTLSIDAKGRIAVPVKFRAKLNNSGVITRGLDRSLFIYPKSEWEVLALKISALPVSKANSRAFARLMLAGAYEFEIDRQGRIMIPENLRKFAGITKKAVAAGLFNRIEIWDEANWQAYKMNSEKESTAIAETLGELGI